MNEVTQAIDLYNQAIKLASEEKESLAINTYKRALKLDSNLYQAHFNLGNIYYRRKSYKLALKHFKIANSQMPNNILILGKLGETELRLSHYEAAIENLEYASTLEKASTPLLVNLALAFIGAQQYEKALYKLKESGLYKINKLRFLYIIIVNFNEKEYKTLLIESISEVTSFFIENRNDIRHIYETISSFDKDGSFLVSLAKHKSHIKHDVLKIVIETLLYSLRYDINYAEKNDALGQLYKHINITDIALVHLEIALKIQPKNRKFISHYIDLLYYNNKIDLAKKLTELYFIRDESNAPNYIIRFYLDQHNFVKAWKFYNRQRMLNESIESETLTLCNELPDTDSSVMIICDQGIGDQIMYLSCLNDFQEIHKGKISLTIDDRLVALVRNSFKYLAEVIPISNFESTTGHFDKYIRASRLPSFTRNHLNDFLTQHPYLYALSNININSLLSTYNNKFKVGFAWKGGSNVLSTKSLPLAAYSPLFDIPDIDFINLQYGDCNELINIQKKYTNVHHLKNFDVSNNFSDLASLISNLDAVIQISNASAHLSASIGTKTFVLVRSNSDFRWFSGVSSEESPWYPSVHLIHQNQRSETDFIQDAISSLTEYLYSLD